MTKSIKIIPVLFDRLLSQNTRGKAEKIILNVALLSFFIHLAIIYFIKFDFIDFSSDSELLKNPISAVYTPFSFILIYEVYLLIYYLPKSFTTYITKQYDNYISLSIHLIDKKTLKGNYDPDYDFYDIL